MTRCRACSTVLFAAALCGVFNGVLVSYLGVQPIIATLATGAMIGWMRP